MEIDGAEETAFIVPLRQADFAMDHIVNFGIQIEQKLQIRALADHRLGKMDILNREFRKANGDGELWQTRGRLVFLLRRGQLRVAGNAERLGGDGIEREPAGQQIKRRPGGGNLPDRQPLAFGIAETDIGQREVAEYIALKRAELNGQTRRIARRALDLGGEQTAPAVGLQE